MDSRALHHYLGITLRNLAILASSEGEIAQAETWYQQVLQIRTDVYGLKHPHRAQSLYDLAVFYHEHERSAEAIHLYQQALAIREQVFGPDHPDTVKTQTSYREAISLRYPCPLRILLSRSYAPSSQEADDARVSEAT